MWGSPTTAVRRRISSASIGDPLREGCPPRPLEALGEAFLFDGVRAIRDAGLAAGLAAGEHLAGVAEPGGVEGVLDPAHALQVRPGENERHIVRLLEADAVLARDGAAPLGPDLEDLPARRHRPRLDAGHARIVEDVRVEIAVAGMEYIAHPEPVR